MLHKPLHLEGEVAINDWFDDEIESPYFVAIDGELGQRGNEND